MSRLQKLAIALLSITATLFAIAGCLLMYLALHLRQCPPANCTALTPPAVIVTVVKQSCTTTPAPNIPPKKHIGKRHAAIPKPAPVPKAPVATPSPAPVPQSPAVTDIPPPPIEVLPPPIAMEIKPKSDWVDCRPHPPIKASCEPSKEQVQQFIRLGNTNLSVPEVMASEGLKNLVCQLVQ
jgi:hypothetical protein